MKSDPVNLTFKLWTILRKIIDKTNCSANVCIKPKNIEINLFFTNQHIHLSDSSFDVIKLQLNNILLRA